MFTPEAVPDESVFAPHHFYIGVIIAVYAFIFIWQWYPRTGAILCLCGLLIALDDALQHAFQIDTPLHHLWWGVLYPIVRWVEG